MKLEDLLQCVLTLMMLMVYMPLVLQKLEDRKSCCPVPQIIAVSHVDCRDFNVCFDTFSFQDTV